jgi:2-alkyl-3-oxoalkanoate reductase
MSQTTSQTTSKTILITGSSGFIGSQLCRYFENLGHIVYGIGRRALVNTSYHYIQYDLRLPLHLTLEPDIIIHAAALSSPWGSRNAFEQNNVLATHNIIEFCKQANAKLVYISSSSVYYKNEHQLNITEQTPLPEKSINLYAATKRKAEELVKQYSGDWLILRPRAVFGPEDTVLFPRILRAAKAGRLPLLKSKDGPVLGDLIYIETLCDYIAKASLNPSITGEFNVTNNQPVVMLEFLLDIFKQLDLAEPKRTVPVERAMMLARVLEGVYTFLPGQEPPITRFGVSVFAYSKTFDGSKTLKVLGEPKVSLEEGKQRFIAWVKEQDSV